MAIIMAVDSFLFLVNGVPANPMLAGVRLKHAIRYIW
jgi:hypothetical protein